MTTMTVKKLFFILSLGIVVGAQVSDPSPELCARYELPSERAGVYHGDDSCDRSQYNAFKDRLDRGNNVKRLNTNYQFNLVPNQKTVVCPLQVENMVDAQSIPGFDTVWIVENTSSSPVVLSYVGKDGVEYSAINAAITPPQNDPSAFLQPKHWRAVYAWHGHVFHARSFDSETGTLGPVLLQHRLGLIPVGTEAQNLACPAVDTEPIVAETGVLDPSFERTTPMVDRNCNTIDIGFRNMANCPLHGYFITKNDSTSCQERFKFHLGLNIAPNDFMWQWDSNAKFEQSFVGHSFAFRSAANPNILVDTVTLQPTRVTDCPELKEKAQINQVTSVGEPEPILFPLTDEGEISKQEQLLDSISQFRNHAIVQHMLNSTFVMNETATEGKRARARSRRENQKVVYAGIRSL